MNEVTFSSEHRELNDILVSSTDSVSAIIHPPRVSADPQFYLQKSEQLAA